MPKVGKYAMSKSNIARDYIRSNYFKESKRDILIYLTENIKLKHRTIEIYYNEIKNELDELVDNEVKNTMRRETESKYYKGKPRQFFRFNDKNLYKCLIKNKKKKRSKT